MSIPGAALAGSIHSLEPARVQFIEQTFLDLLDHPGSAREEVVVWIHRRLFLEGAPVESVRLELQGRSRKTRRIAVTSGKGGVGKTTFSVNLAIAFAQQGLKVLLIDADLGMANTHIFAGVNPSRTLLDFVDGKAPLDEVLVSGPGGVRMICGPSGVGRLANLSEPVLEMLGRELERVASDFDVLVMDTGAGISTSVMRFVGMAQDTVVVSTPNLASILDAYGIIKTVHENQSATRVHVLVNLAEGESQARGVQARIASCADRFLGGKRPGELGFLLREESVEHANQTRRPFQLQESGCSNARRIARIASQLIETNSRKTGVRTVAA